MPELPEVETVCRGLARALEGRRIVGEERMSIGLLNAFIEPTGKSGGQCKSDQGNDWK